MKVGIMQPYLFPYLGYWQLINAVDQFVIYDNIQYEKQSWINRNRIICGNQIEYFTIPLKKGSDYLDIVQRQLSDNSEKDIRKILRKIEANYKKAPYYSTVYPMLEECFCYTGKNLFDFIYHSITTCCAYLGITTPLIISSTMDSHPELKNRDRVLAICKELKADQYVNPIGGVALYDKDEFSQNGIALNFLKMDDVHYEQNQKEFYQSLSMIDVMMFCSKEQIRELLQQYSLQ